MYDGMFFKLARDGAGRVSLYGGDEFAMYARTARTHVSLKFIAHSWCTTTQEDGITRGERDGGLHQRPAQCRPLLPHDRRYQRTILICVCVLQEGETHHVLSLQVRGWRLTVLSCLPISKSTLVYGSCDRGCTVYNSDPHMDRMMDSVGRQLNLKKVRQLSAPPPNVRLTESGVSLSIQQHLCGFGEMQARIVGPTDIEGHRSTKTSLSALRLQ
jgi:hypothetical protein